jgi:hypothetical protein
MSLALLSIGTLAVVGMASGSVPAAAYFAAALAAVGVGLLTGAWIGRARWLIAPGILLSLALAVSTAVPHFGPMERGGGDITWRPTSVAEISDSYAHGVGSVTLDLTGVDFTDHSKSVDVHVNFGDLHVLLPANVDATVTGQVDTGDGHIFDADWSGVRTAAHTVTDNGADGPGGGRLTLTLKVNVGTLEVSR